MSIMQIVLQAIDGKHIATAPITTDEHGYLLIEHHTFDFEFDCALYGYQEGGVSTDIIDDMDSGEPLMRWTVQTSAGKTAPSAHAVDVAIDQIQGIADCERAHAIAVFEEMSAAGFDFDNAAQVDVPLVLEIDYEVRMRAAMV
jgi:hypothetical protein